MKNKGKVIGILNSKGGMGKSTLALHFAMSLYHNSVLNPNKNNKRAVVLDTDIPQYSLNNLRKIELQFLKDNPGSTLNKKVDSLYVNGFEPLAITPMVIADMVENIELIKNNYDFTIVDVVGSINIEDFNDDFLNCFDYIIVPINTDFEPMRSTLDFVQTVIIPSSKKFNFKYDIVLNNIHYSKENYSKGLVEILKNNGINILNTLIGQKDKYKKYKFDEASGMYSSLLYTFDAPIYDLVSEILEKTKN